MTKHHIIYNAYSPWIFDLQKASGSYLWKDENTRLIDFSSGWNVTNLGWNNPEIAAAVAEQAAKNVYAPMWTADPMQIEYANLLTDVLPKRLDAIGRATGGTEANEMAIKMARVATGRTKIIGIRDSYHGQLFATIAAGYRPEYVHVGPVVPDFVQIDYPGSTRTGVSDGESLAIFTAELERLLAKEDIAAILTEPGIVSGWGDTAVAPAGYLKAVRELSAKYGTLLIVDEVGTGFSRCGALFASEIEAVRPDFITLAKGITNGAGAMGAVVTTHEIADATYSKTVLTSTFGWNPLACAAALKTLQIHMRDTVWEKAASDGAYTMQRLHAELADSGVVTDIRGMGMEIGITLNGVQSAEVIALAHKHGLHLCSASEGGLQIMPPLTIERPVLDEGIDMLVRAIKDAARG